MRYNFEIPAIPPSVNGIYKRAKWGGVYKADSVQSFEKIAATVLKIPSPKLKGRLVVSIEYVFSENKKYLVSDIDNCLKVLLDTLATFGIIENDKHIIGLSCRKSLGDSDKTKGFIMDDGYEFPQKAVSKKRTK